LYIVYYMIIRQGEKILQAVKIDYLVSEWQPYKKWSFNSAIL